MIEEGWGSIESPILYPVLFCALGPHKRHSVCPPTEAVAEILYVYLSL